jgi:hypothetical protein
MVPDAWVYRAANRLIRQHGADAFEEVNWLICDALAAELRRQGMSKNQVREILNLRFQQGDPHLGLATTRR